MTRTMKTSARAALLAIAASAALVACGGGGSSGSADTGTAGPTSGTLRVALTDAPACGFDQVNVTVDRVRVHQSATASDTDGGWVEIPVVNGPKKVDLLTLTNGVLMDLGQTALTAGQYSQIRLVLVSNDSVPKSNTVTPTGGVETELKTPSAQQSGLKLINGFTVAPGAVTDVVLDFNACKSVVTAGNSGMYLLKPVITMTPRALGAIVGYVDKTVIGVTVSAQKGGTVIRATVPDPVTGMFTLSLLDPTQGPYDVVLTAKDRTTSVVAAVPAGPLPTPTTLNTSSSSIAMPQSGSGSVGGKVLAPAAATTPGTEVRALQQVGTVPLVEVAFTTTFDSTGGYTLSLPLAAPLLATWTTSMGPFAVQGGAANYMLEASAPGYQTSARKNATAPSTGNDFTLVPSP